MSTIGQDLRYGLRMWRRHPGFTAVAVRTFAVGIGAHAALFSVIHVLLFKPFPFQDLDRLVEIRESLPKKGL